MEDSGNKIQINDDIEELNNLINSQNNEIEDLNNKLNDLRRLLFNQLSDIKEISSSNKSISEEFELLKKENAQFNDLVNDEFESLKKDNAQFNDLVNDEFESLKKENKELKALVNKQNKNNQKILNSYKDNFKHIFYCYDLKPKPFLKNIQDVSQEVLDFTVNVCEKHGIDYWLDAGTLLGAVRHEGYLPWDDDIDLGMMRNDYNRFQEVFDSEIKSHGLYKKMKCKLLKHDKNILYFLQISYAGFAILDIFPYDYVIEPLENMEELYFSEKSRFKSNILNGKSYSQTVGELHKNLNLSFDKQDYVVSGVERSVKGVFCLQKTDEIFPLSKVSFQGKEYCGVNNNDAHLTELYGDWREFPKILDRHNRVYKLKERPGINEFLSEKINALKEINENFNE